MDLYFSSYQRDGLQTLYPGDPKLLTSYAEPNSRPCYSDVFTDNSVVHDSSVAKLTQPSFTHNYPGQGLSLSLGNQSNSFDYVPQLQYQYLNLAQSPYLTNEEKVSANSNESVMSKGAFLNFQSSLNQKESNFGSYQFESERCTANTILNFKYVKPTQQLLDELVNVRKALKKPDLSKRKSSVYDDLEQEINCISSNQSMANPNESTFFSLELSASERQELQDRKTKLLSMLDEVNKRYYQYYHQLQATGSTFEVVAGSGSAKPYTSLALQRISRQFGCLRDAVKSQIQFTRRKLGEQETPGNDERIPRLRYIDHQLRQQKTLQHLGMMRPGWRPQRGLPENSVSILRAWLFEHFLHPYPKEAEKMTLAKQTGLTRNQVANWFINARVRLWKPMIEEMHKEEFGDLETNSSEDNAPKVQKTTSEVKCELPKSATSVATDFNHNQNDIVQQNNQNYNNRVLNSGGESYDISEFDGFGVGNQVSLALGLHHENDMFLNF